MNECEVSFERWRPHLPFVRLYWCTGGYPECMRVIGRSSVSKDPSSGRRTVVRPDEDAHIGHLVFPFLPTFGPLVAAIWHHLQ